MSGIARTSATGAGGMHPELLAWSSSFEHDRALVREDLVGSAAHVTMLGSAGIIPIGDARALRDALKALYVEAAAGTLALDPNEEDVHMAVEAELGRRLGAVAGRLHTARSRNDQVALDLRLHVREQAAETVRTCAALVRQLAERAAVEKDVLLPAYTHRQRAQPVSAAFVIAAWAFGIEDAAQTLVDTLGRLAMPLGSGACSGSSLPIDRPLVTQLLEFASPTPNALDTVGSRAFALDFTWGAARVMIALGKLAADVVDYSTSEFGLVKLDGEISAGSSMMPQKKNPDIFELVRGKSARAVANAVAMMTLVKGLPSGYNRDQQEDRLPVLEAGPLVRGSLRVVSIALAHLHFDAAAGLRALADGSTQATDLAEALVRRGVPFREAYTAVGQLVQTAIADGVTMRDVPVARAIAIHPALDADALGALDPVTAVAAKESFGGTGPKSVDAQMAALLDRARVLEASIASHPTLDDLAARVFAAPLETK
jgi:argininosuccinate lyase